MVAKFLELNGNNWYTCVTFLSMIALRSKTEAHIFSFVVCKCKWPSLSQKIVEIQKSCYQGHLTSHFSLLVISVLLDLSKLKAQWLLFACFHKVSYCWPWVEIWPVRFCSGNLLMQPQLKEKPTVCKAAGWF